MIDSHCHLNLKHFEDDFEAMLAHAITDGVRGFMNIGFDPESAAATVDLVERFPFIFGVVGCHPHDAQRLDDAFERRVREYLDHERIVGIGEIGLDYYRDLSPREAQQDVFRRLIALAREKSVPIVIHCRDAFDDVVSILQESGHHRGIFHAFAGTPEEAQRVIDLGFHIGVGGVVTFRNSQLAHTLQSVPLDRIVLETDSPYLTPDPYRGKRNEPSYVVHVARAVAAIKGVSLEEVSRTTDENFCRAMGISPAMLPRPVYKVGAAIYIHPDATPAEIAEAIAAGAEPAAPAREHPAKEPMPAQEHGPGVHPEDDMLLKADYPAEAADATASVAGEEDGGEGDGGSGAETETVAVAPGGHDRGHEDAYDHGHEHEDGDEHDHGDDEEEEPTRRPRRADDDPVDIVEPWADVEAGPPEELVVCGVGEPLENVERVLEAAAVARGKGLRVRVNTAGTGNQIAGRDITPDLAGRVDEVVVLFYGATARQHDRVAGDGGEERFEVMKDFVRCAVASGMDTVCEFVAAPRFRPEPVRELAKSLGAQYDIRMYRS